MTRRRKIALLAGVAAVAGIAAWRLPVARLLRVPPERRALEEKINSSLRILTYPIERGRPLTIALLPQDQELKLLTNLEVPESAVERPLSLAAPRASEAAGRSAEFVYGLRVAYLDANGLVIQTAEYWERTTKTRIRDPGALVDREEAFFPSGPTTPSDTRATYLLVRDLVARGAVTMRIDLEEGSGHARVLARCLRAVELTREEAIERWAKMREEDRDRALREVNLYKADLVSEAERLELMRRQWQVVPALAARGEEHPTVPVYYTSFFETYEPPRDELFHAALADPHHALALNLVGPLNLWIEVVRATEPSSSASASATAIMSATAGPPLLELSGLREDGAFLSRIERLDPATGGDARAPIHIPLGEGPATLYCRPLNFRAHVRFYVDRANSLEGSEVTRVVSAVGERERYLEVRPEVLATNYYDAGTPEGGIPVEAEVVHPQVRGSDGTPGRPAEDIVEVRLAVRMPIPVAAAAGDPRRFELEVEMLRADGSSFARRTLAGLAEPSLYDTYWRELDEAKLVSEPEYFTLRCPPAVRRLRVRAAERVDVAFYSRLETGEDVTFVPEDYPRTPDIRISEVFAGKLRGKTWFYYRPSNQFELAAAGREVRVEVQRRLFQPRERTREAYEISNFARTVEPLAPAGRAALLEPAREERARIVIGRPNARFSLRPGRDESIVLFDPIDPQNPRPLPVTVRWAAAEPEPEGTGAGRESILFAYVDGRRAAEAPLPAAGERRGGVLDLGAFPQGPHALRIEVYARRPGEEAYRLDEAPPFRFFVDHPVCDAPAGGSATGPPRLAALHYEREAYPLASGAPFELEIEKTGIEPVVLNFVLFAPRPERPPLPTDALAAGAALLGAGTRDDVIVDIARVREGEEGGRGGGAGGGGAALEPIETRRFSIKRPWDGAALGEDEAGRSLRFGPGERFFAALRPEFDPGIYRVRVRRAAAPGTGVPASDDPLYIRASALDPARARISRERFARLNLKGPLRLRVALDPAEVEALGATEVRLLAKVVPGEARGMEDRILRRDPATGAMETTIDVPEGLRTVIAGTLAEPLTARFFIDAAVDALAGVYALAIPDDVRRQPWLEIVPDATEAAVWRVDPGAGSIVWPVPGGEAPLLRIEASIALDRPSEVEPVPFAYEVRFLDPEGRTVTVTAVAAEATFARASSERTERGRKPISEPDARLFVPPPGAAGVAVAVSPTAVPVHVALEHETPGLADVHTPADYERPPGLRRADLAHRDERSLPLDPIDAAAHVAAGRRRTVSRARARVREVIEPPPATGFAEALVPEAYDARSKLLEPLARGAIADPAAWGETLFAQVRANDRVRFVVRDPLLGDGAASPAWATRDIPVYYDFGEAALEGEIATVIDGERRQAFVPVEAHGRFVVRGVPLGAHEIAFGAASGATFYVGAAPAEPALFRPLRERVVARLEEGRDLVVPVEKRPGRDLVLNGALYLLDAPPPGACIEVVLENAAALRRRGEALSEATRPGYRFYLGEAAPTTLLDLDRFAILTMRVYPFFVPLKADLGAGEVRARVRLRGAKEAAVRFMVLRPDAPIVERARPAVLRRD